MGNISSSCLPSSVAHTFGLPDEQDLIRARYEAAKTKLEEGIGLLKYSEERADKELSLVNQEILVRNARGDKAGAMMAFKSKIIKEKQRDKTRNTRTRLETQLDTLFQSQFNGELHTVLQECNNVLQKTMKAVTPDQVQRTMDDLEDAYNDTEEISQALTAGGGGPDLEREAEDATYDGLSGEGGQSALEKQFESFLSTAAEKKVTESTTPTSKTTLDEILRTAPSAPHSDPYIEEPDDDFGDQYTTYKGMPSEFTKKTYVQEARERTAEDYLGRKQQQQGGRGQQKNISGKRIVPLRPPLRGRIKPSRGPGPMQRPRVYQKTNLPPGTVLVNGKWKRPNEAPMYT